MVAQRLMPWTAIIMYVQVDSINILLTELVARNELSYPESEIFLDFAYDLVLNGYNDEEIEHIVITDINETLEEKQNAKLL